MPRLVFAAIAVFAAACLQVAAPASAAEPDPWDRARQQLKEGRYAEAAAEFDAILRGATGETAWKALLGLALARELAGETVAALGHYQRFLAMPEVVGHSAEWTARRAEVVATAERLEEEVLETHARLVLESRPPGATLSGGGLPDDARAPRVVYVRPGTYRFAASLEGHEGDEHSVRARAGMRRKVLFELAERRPDIPDGPPDEPPPVVVAPAEPDATRRAGMWAAVGIGAACLATGAILTGVTFADADEVWTISEKAVKSDADLARDALLRERIEAQQAASWVMYGLGAAGVVTALVLWATEPDPEPPEGVPAVAPVEGGAALIWSGRF